MGGRKSRYRSFRSGYFYPAVEQYSIAWRMRDRTSLAPRICMTSWRSGVRFRPVTATRSNIRALVDELYSLQPEDNLIFFFAGHGISVAREDETQAYVVPVDVKARAQASGSARRQYLQVRDVLTGSTGITIMQCFIHLSAPSLQLQLSHLMYLRHLLDDLHLFVSLSQGGGVVELHSRFE